MTPLPHNPAVERHVLSACLKDAGETYRRAIDAGITDQSFHDPRHILIWRTLSTLSSPAIELLFPAIKPSEIPPGYLLEIDNIAPTTAHAGQMIGALAELSQKRTLIRSATALIEHANNGTTLEELAEQAKALIPRAPGPDLAPRLYTAQTAPEKPAEIFTAAGTTICTPGNLTTIYSQAKAGKTALIGAMIAAAFDTPGSVNDTLGFRSANPGARALLHFDTEQSRYDWSRMISTACRRVGLDQPPPWFLSYNLTGLGAPDCRRFLAQAIRQATAKHQAIHSIFLDGVADFVISPNSEEECFPFVTDLHGLAIAHDCPIISILHMNAGSENEKGRGHLGSQLERKSESNLTMEKKDEVTSYWGVRQRGKAIPKSQAPSFRWSDEHQYHVSCATTPSTFKGGRPKAFTVEAHLNLFPSDPAKAMSKLQLLKFVQEEVTIKETAFRDALNDGVRNGTLIRTTTAAGAIVYHINPAALPKVK